MRMRKRQRLSGKRHGAGVRPLRARKNLEQGRFSSTVLAEQTVDFAGGDLEIDDFERLDPGEALAYLCHAQQRFRHVMWLDWGAQMRAAVLVRDHLRQ